MSVDISMRLLYKSVRQSSVVARTSDLLSTHYSRDRCDEQPSLPGLLGGWSSGSCVTLHYATLPSHA